MTILRNSIASMFFVSLLFFSTACTTSAADNITTTLELAVDAALAAAPSLEAVAGANPAVVAAVTTALTAAEACLNAAQNTLTGTSTVSSVGAAQIIAACATAVLPSVPAGTPSNVAAAIAALGNAISTFIGSLPKAGVAAYVAHPEMVNSFAGSSGKTKLNKKALKRIAGKLTTLHGALHKRG